MRKSFLIAWREYSEAVKSKGFIVGIALAPILMFGSIAVSTLTANKVDTSDQSFAIVDRSGTFGQALKEAADRRNQTDLKDKSGKTVRPRYVVVSIAPKPDAQAQRLELSD